MSAAGAGNQGLPQEGPAQELLPQQPQPQQVPQPLPLQVPTPQQQVPQQQVPQQQVPQQQVPQPQQPPQDHYGTRAGNLQLMGQPQQTHQQQAYQTTHQPQMAPLQIPTPPQYQMTPQHQMQPLPQPYLFQQPGPSHAYPQYFNSPLQYAPAANVAGPSGFIQPWGYQTGDATVQQRGSSGKVKWATALDECSVCLTMTYQLKMFWPCRHMPYCTACVRKLSATHDDAVFCPVCQENKNRVITITRKTPGGQ